MTACQLFEWAYDNIPAVSFEYCSTEDYKREQTHLEEWIQRSRTIPEICKLNSFVPVSKDRLKTEVFSSSIISKKERITSQESELPVKQISGFVTCYYNEHWWVAYVLQLHADTSEVKLTFLHSHWPAHSFRYPQVQNILNIPASHFDYSGPKNSNWSCLHFNTKGEWKCFRKTSSKEVKQLVLFFWVSWLCCM